MGYSLNRVRHFQDLSVIVSFIVLVTNTELPQFYCSNYRNCGFLAETIVAKVNFSQARS